MNSANLRLYGLPDRVSFGLQKKTHGVDRMFSLFTYTRPRANAGAWRGIIAALAICAFAFLPSGAVAGGNIALGTAAVNVSPGLTFTANPKAPPAPLAIHGFDAVAYHTASKPMVGSSRYATSYKGAIYWFASKENQKLFTAAPAKYAPQYGGYCAFGVTQQTKFDGDPALWTIHEGKLYLNVNPQIQAMFRKDVAGNVKSADRLWPKIKNKEPMKLFAEWRKRQ